MKSNTNCLVGLSDFSQRSQWLKLINYCYFILVICSSHLLTCKYYWIHKVCIIRVRAKFIPGIFLWFSRVLLTLSRRGSICVLKIIYGCIAYNLLLRYLCKQNYTCLISPIFPFSSFLFFPDTERRVKFCWPCIVINPNSKNQQDALFAFNLFQ